MKNLKDLTEGKLSDAIKFAKERKDVSLIDCLKRLRMVHGKGYYYDGGFTNIYTDCAPYSFGFTRYNPDGTYAMNGGIIFHGKHDNGGDGSSPSYSVCLTPCNGWKIHT